VEGIPGDLNSFTNVGNDKELLIKAITQCMPYMGFSRTLNAINCVYEIATATSK
jgi:4-carboxymuconolactone decarboxylase